MPHSATNHLRANNTRRRSAPPCGGRPVGRDALIEQAVGQVEDEQAKRWLRRLLSNGEQAGGGPAATDGARRPTAAVRSEPG